MNLSTWRVEVRARSAELLSNVCKILYLWGHYRNCEFSFQLSHLKQTKRIASKSDKEMVLISVERYGIPTYFAISLLEMAEYGVMGDVHNQLATDNGKRPLGGGWVFARSVVLVESWHFLLFYNNSHQKVQKILSSFQM